MKGETEYNGKALEHWILKQDLECKEIRDVRAAASVTEETDNIWAM